MSDDCGGIAERNAHSRGVGLAVLFTSSMLALALSSAAAQDSALVNGSRIRIESTNERQVLEGTFRSLTPDSLIFSPGLDTSTQTLPLSSVGKIEVSRYHTRVRSVLASAAIGSAVGLGATLAVAGGCQVFHRDCGLGLVFASPFVVGGGFLIGALIGSENRSQHWRQVYPPERSASLSIGPTPHGGLAIGLRVPFGSAPTR
jgi:hypothetical protein